MNDKERTEKALLAFGLVIIITLSSIATLNFAISSMPQATRVACVGDSITVGGYPFRLQQLLGSNFRVENFGVSGSTVSQESIRPYMDQPEFKKALEFDPDIIVIMLGTNDANPQITQSGENFEIDYTKLITSFRELEGQEGIWIAKSPPIFADNSAYNNTYLANTVLPQVENLANQLNLPTIDVNSPFENHSEYFSDGVHPNDEGSALIASMVYDAITPVGDFYTQTSY